MKALPKRGSMCMIGEEVLQAIRDIKAGRVFHVEVTQATEAQLKRGLSPADFAAMQDWEPSGAAKALPKVTAPKTLRKVLAAARDCRVNFGVKRFFGDDSHRNKAAGFIFSKACAVRPAVAAARTRAGHRRRYRVARRREAARSLRRTAPMRGRRVGR